MMPGRRRPGKKASLLIKKSAQCTRRTHTPAFKAQVAVAALREDKTMEQLPERAAAVFDSGAVLAKAVSLTPLHTKIGLLTLENDFLKRALSKTGLPGAKR